jgi:arylsulfatase A-like enzyme
MRTSGPAGRRWIGRGAGLLMLAALPGVRATLQPPIAGASTTPPNVLVIVTDDQRINTMHQMPKAKDLFAGGGTSFPHAFVTTPLCCPSRASIFTGEYAHNHGVTVNPTNPPILDHKVTIQHALNSDGYETAIVGKFLNSWDLSQPPPYFDHYAIQVGYGYRDPLLNIDGSEQRVSGFDTDILSELSVGMLDDFESEDAEPWFLYVAPIAPHKPYGTAYRYQKAPVGSWDGDPAVAEKDRTDKPPIVQAQSSTLVHDRATRKAQLRSGMAVDDLVAALFAELDELGEQNTIALFLSDNGFLWGEHGVDEAKRLPYLQSVQVPFFLRWPGHVAAGAIDNRIVANVDIAPTLLQAAGLPADTLPVDGMSLLSAVKRRALLLEYRRSPDAPGWPSWNALVTKRWEYVEWLRDDLSTLTFREYYDLQADPWQLDNVLRDGVSGNQPPDILTIQAELAAVKDCAGSSCVIKA